jgi:cell wall-associated NlpC family hydrolase
MIRQIILMAALASAGGASAQGGPKSNAPAKEVRFLEDIEVGFGPSNNSTSVNTNKPAATTSAITQGNVASAAAAPRKANFSIENAGTLHLKFAVLLNTEVEAVPALPLLVLIDDWWGTKYRLGGNDRNGIDCSGFTCMLFTNLFQTQIPRTAREQFAATRAIDPAQLREGDLVFFTSGGSITHVGFYLQNNKFVHASTSEGVTISDLNDRYWQQRFAGAGRWEAAAGSPGNMARP